jgi:hypothetical protein
MIAAREIVITLLPNGLAFHLRGNDHAPSRARPDR